MILMTRPNTSFLWKLHNLSAFIDELGTIKWAEMPGLNDPSCAYEIFVEKYISIYDK